MPTYQGRAIVNGKMIAATVERDEEPSKEEWEEILLDAQRGEMEAALNPEPREMFQDEAPVLRLKEPRKNPALDGREFDGISFQCSACGSALKAVFQDGFLQIAPCPTCLGEMEKIVAATEVFLKRRT